MEQLPNDLRLKVLKYIKVPKTNIQKVFEYGRNNGYSNTKTFKGCNKLKVLLWTLHLDIYGEPISYNRTKIKILPPNHPRYPNCHKTNYKLVYKIN